MNPQDPTKKASESAASLSFATHLMGQMMQHQNPQQASGSPQDDPESTEVDNTENTLKTLVQEVEDLKQKVGGGADKEIELIRSQLEELLADESNPETNETEE